MCGSKTCNGDQCGDLYPAEKFDHPTICRRRQVSAVPLLDTAPKKLSRGTSGRYSGGNPRQSSKWQGNAPRPQQADKQGNAPGQDLKAVKDLKAKLSKARTDLKAKRLCKRPKYSQVAVPTMPLPTPAPQQQPPPLPLVNVTGSKSDKLADALRMMAEQLAVISAM
jgi:hypothetical protein